ncbi:MAG: PilZ domain-containing protein [Hyphomicrobiaceae bacterium]|nr:PilZ domain-containing protein [Hyphomicrobiaceae bacterium]
MLQVSPSERRRFGRRSCRVHGWVHPNRHTRAPCVMTDYSRGGARLTLSEGTQLPSRFQLTFDGMTRAVDCELRHDGESNGIVGVEFVANRAEQIAAIDELLARFA